MTATSVASPSMNATSVASPSMNACVFCVFPFSSVGDWVLGTPVR